MYQTHLSAKTRTGLSKPAKNAIAHFEPGCRILDYGCGKGSDVEHWNSLGYDATGYDPYWQPELPEGLFDVVTNFYVLNVIHGVRDRIKMLKSAWEYTQDKLIVAALVGVETNISDDGRYFTEFLSPQIKRMIILATRRWHEAIAQGVYFVSRKWAEIPLYDYYSAEDAIADIRQKSVARDNEFISQDGNRHLYHFANGTKKIIKPENLSKCRDRIERREKIRVINFCTF